MRSVESKFVADSTGFGTSNFQRWFSYKHGKEISSREWVKCHFMTGTFTNTITAVKITTEIEQDCPQLLELTETTRKHFEMEEFCGDKAYLSRDNLELLEKGGTRAYIPFKSNSQPGNGLIWNKLYHYFNLHNEEFLKKYHQRSNGESTVHMIKSKFGDSVRSKKWTAQVNEVLCKCICHNICCVIMEMHTLGIKGDFSI